MKKILLCLALLAAVQTASATTRIIPVAGHVPGANQTTWVTDVSITNRSAGSAVVELVFHPDRGDAQSRVIALDGGQSILLEDAVNPASFTGTNPASWLGQLEIRSSADISASAHIFTNAANGGTFGSTFESVDPAALSNSGAMTGLMFSDRFRSNVAFANPTDDIAAFDYALRGVDGFVVATRRILVAPHGTRQISISGDVARTSDDIPLFLSWTSNTPGYVVGSVIDNRSGDPTNVQSTAGGATSLFFPVVGKTPGGLGTFWSTSVAVSSTSDADGSITFVYQDATGQTFTKTVLDPPHGTVHVDDLNAFLGAPNGSGALTILSTTRIAGAVRVFNTQADGSTFGSSVLPQEPVVRSSNVRIRGVRRDDAYRLNVAISNDDSAADGRVRLFDDRGREIESEPFHVEHGRSIQVSMRGETEVRSGEIEVETEHGIPVTVIASNIDNRTGDTVVHESEQENERQQELEIEINPRTAAVGAPVAFSLRSAGTNVASVKWSFGDGTTATGLTATHVYASAGEFDVTAEITLVSGAIVRDREDVHITGDGTGTNPASIDFTYTPAAPAAGQQVTFTAIGSTNGGTWKWKFPGDLRMTGAVATFTFAAAGSYEVELELEHAGSTTLHATRIVIVGGGSNGGANATSIDFTWTPSSPRAGQAVTFTASSDRQPPAGAFFKWRFPNDSRPQGTTASYTFAAPGTYKVRVELEQPGQPSIEREKSITVQP